MNAKQNRPPNHSLPFATVSTSAEHVESKEQNQKLNIGTSSLYTIYTESRPFDSFKKKKKKEKKQAGKIE